MPDIIFHIDDVGATHGSNVAMEVLWGTGLITSGSVIVPSGWFPETVDLARRRPHIDFGVHLTLNSESAKYRWQPLSTSSPASGLIDDDGYFWKDVPSVRRHAHPEAVEGELRAQIDRAREQGIVVSHLDHHMGAALVPEVAPITVALGVEYGLPTLFPHEFDDYASTVHISDAADDLPRVDLDEIAELRQRLDRAGLAVADRFVMGLGSPDRPVREVYEALLTPIEPGVTYVSLHCAAPGEITAVHPRTAAFRIHEFDLFGDPGFVRWVIERGWKPVGFRDG